MQAAKQHSSEHDKKWCKQIFCASRFLEQTAKIRRTTYMDIDFFSLMEFPDDEQREEIRKNYFDTSLDRP